MTWNRYCRGKFVPALIFITADILAAYLLFGLRINRQVSILLLGVMIGSQVLAVCFDYWKKKRFYDSVFRKLEKLDQKYLLPELLEHPDFGEGEVLTEVLYETDRAMHEYLRQYRDEMKELQDYMELWVHEIKLPIASLVLMLHNDNLLSGEKVRAQVKRIECAVEQILYYTRGQNTEKDYLIKTYSLEQIIGRVLQSEKEAILGQQIHLKLEGLKCRVQTDSKWMEFIVRQILNNSLKYLKGEEDEIRITGREEEDCTILSLWDNGIGIEESELSRVFEKSFTGENGRRVQSSTGMGLYLCKKLCGKLGHDILIHSVKNSYTEVEIRFWKHEFYQVLEDDRKLTKL